MRFAEIFYWAREVMRELDLHSLPISPFRVCSMFSIPTISYTEACSQGFQAIIEKMIDTDVDGFCYKGNGERYIIFYDDARTPKERINFTIAHELGHIILGHLENAGMLPRYMMNRKNDPREREADAFAGELIRPPILFVLIGWQLPHTIRTVCNITYEAATVCSKQVQILRKKRDNPYYFKDFKFYHEQFFDFLYTKYCRRCHHVFVDDSAKFCPICACKFLGWFNDQFPTMEQFAAETEGVFALKYKDYPVNDKKQVVHCLRCDNEDLRPDDRFCKICGAPVYNYCTGVYDDIDNGVRMPSPDQNCDSGRLPSNARFCTSCGSVSAFYYAGLLSDWEKEQKDNQNAEIALVSKISTQHVIPDDDIPF